MSFVFSNAKKLLFNKSIDFVADDLRVALLMTNTTVAGAGQEDVATIAAITTVDEYDGAAYVRKALANKAVAVDNAGNKGTFDADDVTWAALGAGTRSAKGVLLFKFVTTDADHIPIAWFDAAPFPLAGNGGDLTVRWAAAGILATT